MTTNPYLCACQEHEFPPGPGDYTCPQCGRLRRNRSLEDTVLTFDAGISGQVRRKPIEKTKSNFFLVVLLIVLTVVVAVITTYVVSGQKGFVLGLVFSVALDILGFFALTRVREIIIERF